MKIKSNIKWDRASLKYEIFIDELVAVARTGVSFLPVKIPFKYMKQADVILSRLQRQAEEENWTCKGAIKRETIINLGFVVSGVGVVAIAVTNVKLATIAIPVYACGTYLYYKPTFSFDPLSPIPT